MSTTEQKAQIAQEIWAVMREHEDRCDLEVEDVWPEHMLWAVTDILVRRLSAENEALRAQSDAFERKLAELVDLVSPGLDSGDLLDDATSAGVQANALRAQVEALTKVQEPVHWRAVLASDQVPHQLKTSMHIVGFRNKESAEQFVAEQLDFQGWRYTLEPLYAHPTPSPLTRPAVPEGWKPSHQELYAMSKDAGQLTVMPPLEWLICFSARVLAAAPQPPGEVAGPAVTAELAGHFREALAWGKVYGARMELELWDEMRERMVLEFTRRAAAPQPEAQPEPVSIELDFKQATELLEMFGGEPGLVTLIPGDGHSGQGLYACWTDVPGEGAIYLGNSDDEARPEARPEAQPADPHANCPPPVDEIEAAEREHLGCAHCKTGIYAEAQPTEAAQKGGV